MSAVLSAHSLPTSRGFEPAGSGANALPLARSTRAAASVPRLVPGVIRLSAVPRADGALDFMWEYVSETAAPLLPCRPWQLLGRRMSEGRAGAFDHPALIERYRCIVEQGAPRSFEQVHLVQGQQDLLLHKVARMGEGVVVTLINLSAARRVRSSWRSKHARAFMSQCQTP